MFTKTRQSLQITVRTRSSHIRGHFELTNTYAPLQRVETKTSMSLIHTLLLALRHLELGPLVRGAFLRSRTALYQVHHRRVCQTKEFIPARLRADHIERQTVVDLLQQDGMAHVGRAAHHGASLVVFGYDFKARHAVDVRNFAGVEAAGGGVPNAGVSAGRDVADGEY